jgi:hypothetical protein
MGEDKKIIIVDWEAYRQWYEENTSGGWSVPKGKKTLTLVGSTPDIIAGLIQWGVRVEDEIGSIVDLYIPVEFVGFGYIHPQPGSLNFRYFNFTDKNSNSLDVDLSTVDPVKLAELRAHYEDDQLYARQIWAGHDLKDEHINWLNQKKMDAVRALEHISFFEQMLAKVKV